MRSPVKSNNASPFSIAFWAVRCFAERMSRHAVPSACVEIVLQVDLFYHTWRCVGCPFCQDSRGIFSCVLGGSWRGESETLMNNPVRAARTAASP